MNFTNYFYYYMVQNPTTGYYTDLAATQDGEPTTRLNFTHEISSCKKRNCALHNNPSLHPLAMEPLVWNDENVAIMRECAHHLHHPDYDDLEYRKSIGQYEQFAFHNCDGCCGISKEYRN